MSTILKNTGNPWTPVVSSSFPVMPESQRAALLAVYQSLGGVNWTNNSGWLGAPGTECSWYGVECDGVNVRGLLLANNNLVGSMPAELGDLSEARWVYLNNNQIAGEIPASLANLSRLEQLRLHSNTLTGAIPDGLASLAKLTELRLQNNQLSGVVPSSFLDAAALTVFQIDNNNFEYSDELQAQRDALIALFESTNGANWTVKTGWMGEQGTECSWHGVSCFGPYVVELALVGNNLSGALPAEIGDLVYLKKLIIRSNSLWNSEIPSAIGNLSALLELDLSANGLGGSYR